MAIQEVPQEKFPQLFNWSRAHCWSDRNNWRGLVPHTGHGVYAFLNYSNRTPQFSEEWLFEQHSGPWIVNGRNRTLYVGEANLRSLAERLSEYMDRPMKCNPRLIDALNQYEQNIYVRWAECGDLETELIAHLSPIFNSLKSSSTPTLPSVAWGPWRSWTDVYNRVATVPEHPGCYAFTNYGGSGHGLVRNALQLNPSQLDAATLTTLTQQQTRLVLYVGQGESLSQRLNDYRIAADKPTGTTKCNQPLTDLLRNSPNLISVRWVRHFKFENELIHALKPVFNTTHTTREF